MAKKDFTNAIDNRETKIDNPFLSQENSNTKNTVNIDNTNNIVNTNKVMKTFRMDRELSKLLKDKTFDLRMNQTEIIEQALREYLK